jgi:hypothetical protein
LFFKLTLLASLCPCRLTASLKFEVRLETELRPEFALKLEIKLGLELVSTSVTECPCPR